MTPNKIYQALLILFTLFSFLRPAVASSPNQDFNGSKYGAELSQITGSAQSPRVAVKKISILRSPGGRVAWSPKGDYILIDQKGSDGYYDLYLIRPDGSGEQCLTCDANSVLGKGHKGSAAWHPSGDYVVFQAQKKDFTGRWGKDLAATPGFGRYMDMWLMEVATRKCFQLTHTPDTGETGVLHPHFSHLGNKLTWSEMYNLKKGYWKLNVADFAFTSGRPALSDIKSYEPGGLGFYENDGLTPDGSKIHFTGVLGAKKMFDFFKMANIYEYDFTTKQMRVLASEKYNEVSRYAPNKKRLIWMTSRENANNGTDYWSMHPDGTDKKRVTDFNNPNLPTFNKKMIIAADSSFSPNGTKIAAYVQVNLLTQMGVTVVIELDTDEFAIDDDTQIISKPGLSELSGTDPQKSSSFISGDPAGSEPQDEPLVSDGSTPVAQSTRFSTKIRLPREMSSSGK